MKRFRNILIIMLAVMVTAGFMPGSEAFGAAKAKKTIQVTVYSQDLYIGSGYVPFYGKTKDNTKVSYKITKGKKRVKIIRKNGGCYIKGLRSGSVTLRMKAKASGKYRKATRYVKFTVRKPAAGRKIVNIALPVSKYKNVEDFTALYNKSSGSHIVQLSLIQGISGIKPGDYDGLIIPGGKHVQPKYYGAEVKCTKHGFDPALDSLEMALFDRFASAGKPILGICRGSQLVNVALGGTICQDIGYNHYSGAIRETSTVEGTSMEELYGSGVATLHYHHQAVETLADGLILTMVDSADGTVEAFEAEDAPIYGVQFHPENMYMKEDAALKADGRKYMEWFFDKL